MSDQSSTADDRRSKNNLLFVLLFLVVFLLVLWLLWSWWGALRPDTERVAQVAQEVVVPDVVGIRRAGAVQRLLNVGLTVDYRSDIQVDARPGDVVTQDPAAGTIAARGTLVRLTVSAAPSTVKSPLFPEYAGDERAVPDVIGWSQSPGTNQLESAGFRVSVSEGYSDTFPPDTIMHQRPSGGTTLTIGSTVAIVVSRGTKPVGRVEVPETLGMTEAAAIARIRAAGLEALPTYQPSDDDRIGLVNDQAPFAGEMIREDGSVIIVIGVPRR